MQSGNWETPSPKTTESRTVTIAIINVDETATVTIDDQTPSVKDTVTATVGEDPDGPMTNKTWSWSRSPDPYNYGWTVIAGETAASYTVTSLDRLKLLQATVSYDDPQGTGKTAQATTDRILNQKPVAHSTAGLGPVAYMFPGGGPGLLQFPGPVGTDGDGDPLTYQFRVVNPKARNDIIRIGNIKLSLTQDGRTFSFQESEELTPAQYTDIYGYDSSGVQVKAALHVHDGIDESDSEEFRILTIYDPSAYFASPARRGGGRRYLTQASYETYEGPQGTVITTIPWTSVTAGTRNWGTGSPATPVACRNAAGRGMDQDWPSAPGLDSALFEAPGNSSAKSGNIQVIFKTAPDYENPGDQNQDNEYQVRFYNTHSLHLPTADASFPACSGSAVELSVKVKDVGTPVAVTELTARYDQSNPGFVEVEWTKPQGFDENGTVVPFPHESQDVTHYLVQHRGDPDDEWQQEPDQIGPQATLEVSQEQDTTWVRTAPVNTEGAGPWTTTSATAPKPMVSIAAKTDSIREGETAEFVITSTQGKTIDVNIGLTWMGNHGTDSETQVTLQGGTPTTMEVPTTENDTTETGSLTAEILDAEGYQRTGTNAAVVTINNVTQLNSAATGSPTISGIAQVRQTLSTSVTGINDPDGLPSVFTYQWIRVDSDGISNPVNIGAGFQQIHARARTKRGRGSRSRSDSETTEATMRGR